MSLESLFQHILFSEQRAEESRRLMREGQRGARVVRTGPLSSPVGSSEQEQIPQVVV